MRKSPSIFTAVGVLDLGQSLAVTVTFLGILFAVVYLLNHSDQGELVSALDSPRNWVPILIVALGFIVYPIIMVGVGMRGIIQALSIHIGKRKWISDACSVQVPIINRSIEHNDYAEFKEQEWVCSLTIRIPEIIENEAAGGEICVGVNKRTYFKYEEKDVARVYYDPHDPLTFVFEGE